MRKTPNVVGVLAALRDLDAPNGYALARHAGLAPGTVYRVLDRLHDEGWITVRTAGRHKRYRLTPLGESWVDAWTQPIGEVVTRVRRKGGEEEVIRWLGHNWPAVSAFVGDAVRRDGHVLWIRTVDGNEESCKLGWWIVAGVLNKYPIPPAVFAARYELP
jgi:DNA-binding MarR family transcriptional regulator